METQRDENYEGAGTGTKGGREKDKEHDAMEQDYEEFLDQLEADKEMRGKVNLYKARASSTAKQAGASQRYQVWLLYQSIVALCVGCAMFLFLTLIIPLNLFSHCLPTFFLSFFQVTVRRQQVGVVGVGATCPNPLWLDPVLRWTKIAKNNGKNEKLAGM